MKASKKRSGPPIVRKTAMSCLLGSLVFSACGGSDDEGTDSLDGSDAPGDGDSDGVGGGLGDGDGDSAGGGRPSVGGSSGGDGDGSGGLALGGFAGSLIMDPEGNDECPDAPTSEVPSERDVDQPSEAVSPFIVVDQFGYLPSSEKIAVLRDPRTGFDEAGTYSAPASLQLIDARTGGVVFEGAPAEWNGGAEHPQSGDAAWWFDFSQHEQLGVYFLLDPEQNVRSPLFRIAPDVYRQVMRHAMRTFFYQRAGFEKLAEFAGDTWADGASHVGPGQDKEARLYSALNDAQSARDVSGGWYDAGDFNKYTPWTADYIAGLIRAYEERPEAFRDDLGIPESKNCIPDILDEVRFGLQHLVRLQEEDGSVLSIVDLDHASPPSSASEPSRYGPASTNATLRAAIAYSAGARVFSTLDSDFAADLGARALLAWDWAQANPDVVFENNNGENDLGAGQQQADAGTVQLYRLAASVELYRSSGESRFLDYFEANWEDENFGPLGWYVAGWQQNFHDYYLDYINLPEADASISATFVERYENALGSDDNFGMLASSPDPYLAHVADYTWGSNAHKSRTGLVFYSVIDFGLSGFSVQDAERAASRYVHYLHGVNPLGLVYLSNMAAEGAERSASQFYHTWFGDGTPWDAVPAPGFLTGGPNPSYNWEESCCVSGSCAAADAEKCSGGVPSPPFGQPPQKSYLDFNDNWPLNSWSVTENSNGYQVAYIRLLSKFVQ